VNLRVRWFLGLAILLLGCLVAARWMRTVPVDDRDLRVVIPNVPREDNAFIGLLDAGAALKLKGRALRVLDNWTPLTNVSEALRGILETNRAALQLARQAWQRPHFLAEDALIYTTNEVEYVDHWKMLARLAAVDAVLAFDDGNEAAALAAAESILGFGVRIKNSPVPFLHHLVGDSIERLGLDLVRKFAGQTQISDSSLRDLLTRLDRLPSVEAPMTNAARGEYAYLLSSLDDPVLPKVPGVVNRSATAALLARDFRQVLGLMPLTYQQALPRLPQEVTNRTFFSIFGSLLRGNLVGEFVADTSPARGAAMIRSKSRTAVHREATRACVALALHRRKHGKLPESLSVISPDLLSVPPRDDFDGKPLRYDPVRQILYSVGQDLEDHGGLPRARGREGSDIIFRIWGADPGH